MSPGVVPPRRLVGLPGQDPQEAGVLVVLRHGCVRDEDIMRHARHRDLRTMRGYVRRAGLVAESPAGLIDL